MYSYVIKVIIHLTKKSIIKTILSKHSEAS